MIRCPQCASIHEEEADQCPSCGYTPGIIRGFRAWAPDAAREGEHFDAALFAALAAYEPRNFWFRARNALIIALLQRHASGLTSFLEVGCGTGYVLRGVGDAFPSARRVGSELFVEALPIAAQRNPDAELVQMDARSIPYVQAFDVVSALDVLEHVHDDERVIANLFAGVRPGGLLIATVPQHPSLWSEADEVGYHVRRYRRDELQRKVAEAGFILVRSTSFVSLLLPAMMLSRLRRAPIKNFDPMAEFKIPALLNAAFGVVLGMERAAILAGLDFPVGGSRLVVARRPG